jgi:hypothetical protein
MREALPSSRAVRVGAIAAGLTLLWSTHPVPARALAPAPAAETQQEDARGIPLPDGSIRGIPFVGEFGATESVQDIMDREQREWAMRVWRPEPAETEAEHLRVDRSHLRHNPNARRLASWPPPRLGAPAAAPGTSAIRPGPLSPQTTGTSFTGATLADTGAFPPDSQGTIGPSQFIVAVNGRIRSFNKTTGVADGVLNSSTNTFFNTVRNGSGTSDPRIRYDRLTARWFFLIINVSFPNRILIGVSDAASAGIISGATTFTFFFINISTLPPAQASTCLADYPTLGVDANALYVGTNNFCGASLATATFDSTDGFVIRKSSILGAGPIVATVFRRISDGVGAGANGPYTPQGVDNFSPTSTEGYFIGVSLFFEGELDLRRVSNPGGAPTVSANITLAVNATQEPITVRHLGNTGGTNGFLDALDSRLFAAHLRNGRLWTAHNIGVDNTGVAPAVFANVSRDAVRWYELQGIISPGTPSVVQSGTVFSSAGIATDVDQRNYWIPTIMVSGQGHAALGFSVAGTNERANAGTVGRLSSDALGTMETPVLYTASATAYNPPGDPGTRGARRWGDYSYVSLDPRDDMTMWAIEEFCDAANTYGDRIVKLIAPAPAVSISVAPAWVPPGQASISVTVTGTTSAAGEGFYDPGANLAAPALAFTHLTGAVSGSVTVNSATYVSPTTVTLNISTVGTPAGAKNVTITNPDGQSITGTGILHVGASAVGLSSFEATTAGSGSDAPVTIRWRTGFEVNNLGFHLYRDEGGQRVPLTPRLIAGSALSSGATDRRGGRSYSFTDHPADARSARYWLEDVDLGDGRTWHGPVSVRASTLQREAPQGSETPSIAAPGALALADLGRAESAALSSHPERRSAGGPRTASNPTAAFGALSSPNVLKLSIREDGWYRVTEPELAASGFKPQVDRSLLQLWVEGRQVPLRVSSGSGPLTAGDAVDFYGTGLDLPSTDTRVYWLVAGRAPGVRMPQQAAGDAPVASASFPFAVERKDRLVYFTSLLNGEAENFFGPVVASQPAAQSLTLAHLDTGHDAELEVSVQGVTLLPHHVEVAINGVVAGAIDYEGQSKGTLQVTVPGTSLQDGDNVVSLVSQGAGSDISLVDSVRLTYWHQPTADGNAVRRPTAGPVETLGGFSSAQIHVLDVTDAAAPLELLGSVTPDAGGYAVTVRPPSGERSLLALCEDQFKHPAAMALARRPNLVSRRGADIVMIAHHDLLPAVQSLRALRESQGHSVAVIDVDAVFDSFSYGEHVPGALRDFLSFTQRRWPHAPRFVLLVGAGSYDPRNHFGGTNTDLVPTKLVDTRLMEASWDDWFVDFHDDGLPQLALGRLPARTPAEAATMVGKIVAYERGSRGSGAVLVSDLGDTGYDFAAASHQLRSLLPMGTMATEITRVPGGDPNTHSAILAAVNHGPRFVDWIGHGSVDLWRGEILTDADGTSLTNSKLSLFTMMTCLNGYFTDPQLPSLAESLLTSPGGAVAVWASSGMTSPEEHIPMDRELYQRFARQPLLTLGQAIQHAKAATSVLDVRQTWTLFGDPAMRVR